MFKIRDNVQTVTQCLYANRHGRFQVVMLPKCYA